MSQLGNTASPQNPTAKMQNSLRSNSAHIFVWSVWAVMLAAGLIFVRAFGSDVPLWDEWWGLIPVLTGDERVTPSWFWSLHNNHRLPLPRLMLLFFHALDGHHFRVGMFFNTLAMATVSCVMILTANRLRGHTSYSDVFFPLALLNLGHWINFLWEWQVVFICSTGLSCVLLCIMVSCGNHLSTKVIMFAGTCLILLPLCGANGLMLVPTFALWFLYSAIQKWRSQKCEEHRHAVLLVGFLFVTAFVVALYFRHYDHYVAGSPSHWAAFRVAVQFLTMSFGAATSYFWPLSAPWLPLLFLISTIHLCRMWHRHPADHPQLLGLLLFMIGIVITALAIGMGRAKWGEDRGLLPHYTIIAVPGLCSLYFVWGLKNSWSKVAQAILCMIVAMFLPLNLSAGLYAGQQLHSRVELFQEDILAGTPIFILDERHGYFLNPWSGKITVGRGLEMLRRAQIGLFRNVQPDPKFVEVPVTRGKTEKEQYQEREEENAVLGKNGGFTVVLNERRFVYAIRLTYSYGDPEKGPALLQVFWNTSTHGSLINIEGKALIKVQTGRGPGRWVPDTAFIPRPERILEKKETIWINDTIDRFRILADDKPRLFRVDEIMLLLPEHQGRRHR